MTYTGHVNSEEAWPAKGQFLTLFSVIRLLSGNKETRKIPASRNKIPQKANQMAISCPVVEHWGFSHFNLKLRSVESRTSRTVVF